MSSPCTERGPDLHQPTGVPLASVEDRSQWFSREVQPHGDKLKSYLQGSFPTVHDVDDVVQESYLRIWQAVAVRPVRSAKSFLFQIARRLAVDVLRERKRHPVASMGDLEPLGVMEDAPGDAEAALQEKIAILSDAVAALPDRRREIILLHKFQRLPQREIASLLGLSERTVGNQVQRGVKQVERYLRGRGVRSLYSDVQR